MFRTMVRTPPLLLLLLLLMMMLPPGHAAASTPPSNVTFLSSHRFPMEGQNTIVLCTDPPLAAGAGAATHISEVGVSLRFPTRGHGFTLAAPIGNGTAGCFKVATGVTANVGPGYLSLTGSVAGTSSQKVQIEYYESVAAAFGLRPYIAETTGTLLLAPDAEVLAAAAAPGATPATVSMELPFATPPRTEHWPKPSPAATNASNSGGAALLSEHEQVLTFSLAGLPTTVNQDVKITITLPSGKTIVKWRRLMRAPPLPSGSSVLPVQVHTSQKQPRKHAVGSPPTAFLNLNDPVTSGLPRQAQVSRRNETHMIAICGRLHSFRILECFGMFWLQVDHTTKSLLVDGRPYSGSGFYLDGVSENWFLTRFPHENDMFYQDRLGANILGRKALKTDRRFLTC